MTAPRTAARIVGAALAVLAIACHRANDEAVETGATVPVLVARARVGRIEARLTATGVVDPMPGLDWTIVAPQAGRVVEIPKSEGEPVRRGDLLVRFEAPGLTADAAAKTAEYRQSETRLENARQADTRVTGLFERGIAAHKDLEAAQKELRDAEAALSAARIAQSAAQTMAALVAVRARFDGVVARRWHNPGDTVEASASDPVLRVVDPKQLQVLAQVASSDAGRIVAGRAAHVHRPARSGEDVVGHVTGQAGAVDPTTGTAPVRIALAGGAALAPGTVVQLEIVAETREAAVVVPAAAVVREGDEAFVYVSGADGKAHRQTVALGVSGGDEIEVVSGLKGDEALIVRGHHELPDGAAIAVESR
jgi:RND family efflux transporter MFP subunit